MQQCGRGVVESLEPGGCASTAIGIDRGRIGVSPVRGCRNAADPAFTLHGGWRLLIRRSAGIRTPISAGGCSWPGTKPLRWFRLPYSITDCAIAVGTAPERGSRHGAGVPIPPLQTRRDAATDARPGSGGLTLSCWRIARGLIDRRGRGSRVDGSDPCRASRRLTALPRPALLSHYPGPCPRNYGPAAHGSSGRQNQGRRFGCPSSRTAPRATNRTPRSSAPART